MRPCRYIIAFLVLLIVSPSLFAQKQNNIWYFGRKAGVDFNGPAPRPLTDGQMDGGEGTSSIADRRTGELLFYSNGEEIWNRNHLHMPNGTKLHGHQSSYQSVVIVPDPGDDLKYYVFTTDAIEDNYYWGLQYSVVDMRADSGRGDVIIKNVPVVAPVSEALCAVQQCGGNSYWVITHAPDTSIFYAVAVTAQGISSPVVSHPKYYYRVGAGLTVSHKGNTLATVVALDRGYAARAGLGFFTFDQTSGLVSYAVTVSGVGSGFCFSPDDSKLYAASWTQLYQYEVTSLDSAAIESSKVNIYKDTSVMLYGLQLAPDSKIYSAVRGKSWLAAIDNPNEKGTACSFRLNGLYLESGICYINLPNIIYEVNAFAGLDTAICPGDTVTLHASSGTGIHWSPAESLSCSDCANPLAFPETTTTYSLVVTNQVGCSVTDSVTITVNPLPVAMSVPDTAICIGTEVTLHASGGAKYQWSPSAGLSCADCPDPIARPSVTTTYTVIVSNASDCSSADSVIVAVLDLPKADAGADTSICSGNSVRLRASDGAAWQWSPANGLNCTDCRAPFAMPKSTTTYMLRVTNALGCSAKDSVTVHVLPRPVIDAGSDVAICAGGSTQLHANGTGKLQWSPNIDLSCVDCSDPMASPSSTTTYILTSTGVGGCQAIDSVTITVIDAGSVDAGPSQTICSGDSAQLAASDGTTWNWSPFDGLSCTDCRSPLARPATTTLYTVTVSGPDGCTAFDTVSVVVNPRPQADAGPDVSICSGTSTLLHVSGGAAYRWSPVDGLSCIDCFDPVASPMKTTTYRVTASNAEGCSSNDSVNVIVTDTRLVRAHIERTYRALPGTVLSVPLLLDDAITEAVDTITIGFGYNGGIVRLQEVATQGTLLDGWRREVLSDTIGGVLVRFVATRDNHLHGIGALLKLRLQAFLGDTTASELPFTFSLSNQLCVRLNTEAGRITLDSICGLSYRLIEASPNGYVLKQNDPNPFNPTTTIEFSLGLDGPTRLEVLNAAGKRVALLIDEQMQQGRYRAIWDGSTMPSGLYYYRLTSGTWSATGRMVLVK